jgi:Zn-dependent metalloprotease
MAFGEIDGIDERDVDLFDQWMNEFSNELRTLLSDLDDYDSLEFTFGEDDELSFITGFSTIDVLSSEFFVEEFMEKNGALFGYEFGDFDVFETELDELNKTHYKVMNNIDGIPVYGSELIVHTDEYGKVYAVNGE